MLIGSLIKKIREEKNIKKSEIAEKAKINVGHITHLEKGERNPSSRSLKKICEILNIPYQIVAYSVDKKLTEEHIGYNCVDHISYNKILAVEPKDSITCPIHCSTAHIAIKVPDPSMEPTYPKDSYVFLEFSTPLDYKDVGLFSYNGKILLRRFIIRKDKIGIRADNKDIPDIWFNENDDFTIIGKVIG